MRNHHRHLLACLLLVLFAVGGAHGQIIANPNQIVGTIELTNTNPAILAILEGPDGTLPGTADGFNNVFVRATSGGLLSSTNFAPAGFTSTPYELTVESGPAGSGLVYAVTVDMRLDDGRDFYLFETLSSDPVEEEPAPDVVLDISECVGLVEIQWVDGDGNPFTVGGGEAFAFRSNGATQARQLGFRGTSRELLPVRGDGDTYSIFVLYSTGSSFFTDIIRYTETQEHAVGCDEIVEMIIEVPDVDELGRIIGEVDMLGEFERLSSSTTFMDAQGPQFNLRLDWLQFEPSSGAYELENLPASDIVTPPVPYSVITQMLLRTGRQEESYFSPKFRVLVEGGLTVDLTDTFVMDPALVGGDILLAGAPVTENGSCLEDFVRRSDDPAPPRNFPSNVPSRGFQAAGTSSTLTGGSANVEFDGDFNPVSESFEGDYELVLGMPGDQVHDWSTNALHLRLLDDATPEVEKSYQDSVFRITDGQIGTRRLAPGQVVDQDFRFCFSQVNLTVTTTAGTFFRPGLREPSSGAYSGVDFEGNAADYFVDLAPSLAGITRSQGTPVDEASASDQGLLALCIPQGDYSLAPVVQAINPGGGTSTTALPGVAFTVGCGQELDITPEIQISLDELPACVADSTLTLSGAVTSDLDVERIEATVNGGPATTFCTDCGEDPAYAFDVELEACDNEVTVSAEDPLGAVAAVTDSTRFDGTAPAFTGCEDLFAELDPGLGGAVVDFAVTGADDCDGSRPVSCDTASGSFFPEGETVVSCGAVDECGNQGLCSFTVTVASSCEPVDPDVRTQGFWKRQCKGPHPSGEHDNLPAYVDEVSGIETFADVDSVDAVCDRLTPAPRNDKCEQAEAQAMAVMLNLASGRVAECNCLDDPDLGAVTVADAVAEIDALLSAADRDAADCTLAQAIADRINNGTTLVTCQ